MNDPAQETFDRLDALSRTRALTQAESLQLESAMKVLERKRPASNRDRARMGLKRDMSQFGK